MVNGGFHKRACAVVLVNKVKKPIKLAREMLVRGEKDGSGGGDQRGDAGGAQGHCCLGGETVEKLAKDWGMEMVHENYFWTRKRWDEHKRGLHESVDERTPEHNLPCSEQDGTVKPTSHRAQLAVWHWIAMVKFAWSYE